MAFEQEVDPRLAHLAQFLRKNGITLWEPPYWEDGQANIPDELVKSAAAECGIPAEITLDLLFNLQEHALKRKEERRLAEQGVVTIKVRIQRKEHNLRIPISSTVSDLYEKSAEAANIPRSRIKLILNGRRLDDDDTPLKEKQVRNNTKMIGVVTSAKIEEFIQEELEMIETHRKTSKATSTARTMSALNQCEITNQFGQKVEIPDGIKLDLTAALSLHDKGRFEMRRGNSEQALNYLLEAERIAHGIDTSTYPMLEQLSNVPLLNLDIVWCFLEAGSLNHLTDGDRRLLIAEQGFIRAYGENMERVTRAKGSATNEQTLFVRLKLLQGVSSFYKANYAEARKKFTEVEELMARLKVDQEHLLTLMSLGFNAKESRIALRQTNNIPDLAVTYLEEKEMLRMEEVERWRKEQQGKYLEGINRTWYERMINDVGVSPAAARHALRTFSDDYSRAVDCAMEYECSLNKSKREREKESPSSNQGNKAGPSSAKNNRTTPCESDISALVDMGVEQSSAGELLEFFNGSRIDAENYLLTGESNQDSEINSMLSKMRRFVSEEAEDYLDSTLERELECLSAFSERLAQIRSAVPDVE